MKFLLANLMLLLLLAFAQQTESLPVGNGTGNGNIWAVLIAGSNSFLNYRHQADICHAFHVLHDHGVPEEQIIVMMYDDIAHNKLNPFPGQLFNHPNGKDVYAGVPKDYTGKLVTAKNVMKVLKGEAPEGGSGKTLKSGPDDYVFINYVDHGAPGILGMPFPAPDFTAKELLATLKSMNDAKQFKQLVLYIESCESGSMFAKKLPKDINIYATTAANPRESSYACYYDEKIQAYLGDLYSTKWMENSDQTNLNQESLKSQFMLVKKEVNLSHVMEYGELGLAKEPVGFFQGHQAATVTILPEVEDDTPVPSPDVPLLILMEAIQAETNTMAKDILKAQLDTMLQKRSFVKSLFFQIVKESGHPHPDQVALQQLDLTDLDCHDAVVKHFSEVCLPTNKNPFSYRFIYMLVNLCEDRIPIQAIKSSMNIACADIPADMTNIL